MRLVHEALLDQRLCGLYAILVVQAAVRLAIIVKKLHNCRRFTTIPLIPMSTTLQQFIDEFLQGNDNPEISTALSQEFVPPPEPPPGPLMDPRAAAALSALAANGLSDEQSTLQGLLSCVPADQQGNPLDILLNLASLFERAGLMTQPRAVAPSPRTLY